MTEAHATRTPDAPPNPTPLARAWWPTLLFIGALALARIVYLVWLSPYALAEDEAYYWEWGRRLDWSYYSKGPGVAWLIGSVTWLLGNTEWAVRLPAVLAGAVGSLAAAGLASDAFRDRRAGLLAAVLYQCVPGLHVSSMLMTIDAPYFACWTLGAWAGFRALERASGPAWLALGLAIAAGFLFKYTVLLLPAGLLLHAAVRRRRLNLHTDAKRWIAGGLALVPLGLVPVVVWNAANGWPTVQHLLGHLGLPGGDVPPSHDDGWSYNPLWTLEYLGLQIAVGGPVLFLAILAIVRRNRLPAARGDILYPALVAAPIFAFYLGVSLLSETQGNWALAGFTTLAALGAFPVVAHYFPRDRLVRALFHGALIFGIGSGLGFVLLPVLDRSPRFGHLVPLHRLVGVRDLARTAESVLDDIRERTGEEPFVMAGHYGRAAHMAFYLPGHPTTYCASSFSGGRRNDYDFWPDTDLRSPDVTDRLRGRPALLLGGEPWLWERAFDTVEPLGSLEGEPKGDREAYIGLGYRGFDQTNEGED